MPSTTPTVELRPARHLLDALRMRRIRNAVRLYMTRDRAPISLLRQVRWWRGEHRVRSRAPAPDWPGTLEAWLLWSGARAVGYGLVSHDRGRWWVSGGILPAWRGRGLGRILFRHLTARAFELSGRMWPKRDREAWLEVLAGNRRAVELYLSLGYKLVGADHREGIGSIALMRAEEASAFPANP